MKESSKFDELLALLGTGKWNLMYSLTASYWYMIIPSTSLSGIYLAPNIEHTCLPPDDVPVTRISQDSCSYFINASELLPLEKEENIQCQKWTYNTSIYSSTLTSEFDLVCERSYLRATYQSMTSVASIFSAVLAGYLTDKYGRKAVTAVNSTIFAFLSVTVAMTTNFSGILFLRFLMGCFSQSTLYVLAIEVCELKHRSLVGILTGLPWALGTMAWGGIAYLIRDWRYLQFTVSVPYLLILPAIFALDESPRWLILKGQHARAVKVLKRAAKWNKAVIPPEDQLQKTFLDIEHEQAEAERLMKNQEAEEKKKKEEGIGRFLTLPRMLSTPRIRLLIAMLTINLFISALVFCGLNLSGSTYSSDPFLYIVISGLMEVPSYTLTAPLIKCLGRKKPTIIGYFISGLTILALAFIPSDISWLSFTLAMLGKMTNSGGFMIMFVYMTELLPTEVRLQGMGTTMTFMNLGAILAPYVTDYLGSVIPWFPSVIFGVSSFIAGLVLLPLPETLGMAMMDTIEDMEITYRKTLKTSDVTDNEAAMILSE